MAGFSQRERKKMAGLSQRENIAMKRFRAGFALALFSLIFLPGVAHAQDKKGTITMGFQYQYGLIGGDSDYSDNYGGGLGYGIRLRYHLGKKRAIGVSFENQYHNSLLETRVEDYPKRLQFNTAMIEFFRYFDRGKSASRYLTLGAGVFSPTILYSAGGPERRPDGPAVSLGGGVEFFLTRSLSMDVSLRGFSLANEDGLSLAGHFCLGLEYYVTD